MVVNKPGEPCTNVAETQQIQHAKIGLMEQVEQLALVMLKNPYIWLVLGIGLYMLIQLSILQHTHKRFDQNSLMAFFTAVIEFCAIANVILLSASLPSAIRKWRASHVPARMCGSAIMLASAAVLFLLSAILICVAIAVGGPAGFFPDANFLPLAVLQRGSLLAIWAVVLFSLIQFCVFSLNVSRGVANAIGIAMHCAAAFYVTRLSYTYPALERLNDLFLYNLLQGYLHFLPKLASKSVFHNIGTQYYVLELSALILIWWVVALLWIPYATRRLSRET